MLHVANVPDFPRARTRVWILCSDQRLFSLISHFSFLLATSEDFLQANDFKPHFWPLLIVWLTFPLFERDCFADVGILKISFSHFSCLFLYLFYTFYTYFWLLCPKHPCHIHCEICPMWREEKNQMISHLLITVKKHSYWNSGAQISWGLVDLCCLSVKRPYSVARTDWNF